MESTQAIKVVQKYLQVLGFEPEATQAYLELAKLGPSSALQLAKQTGISRTQIYRRLEELQAKGLVSNESLSYGTLFRALPFENIEALLATREAETQTAQRNLAAVTNLVYLLAGSAGPKATVQHYYGLAGLKQVNWNLTKANKEFKVFEVAHLSQHLDKAFARRCRERYIEKQLTTYDLTNALAVARNELEPYDPTRVFVRQVDPDILRIGFETYIYNDCVTLLDYSGAQQLAIEIHHPLYKAMMEQMFDAIWNLATPLEIS